MGNGSDTSTATTTKTDGATGNKLSGFVPTGPTSSGGAQVNVIDMNTLRLMLDESGQPKLVDPSWATDYYSVAPKKYPANWARLRSFFPSQPTTKGMTAALGDAVTWQALGQTKNPIQFLTTYDFGAVKGGSGSGSGSTTTSQAVIYSESSAKAAGNAAWQEALGRDMTDQELKAFTKAINSASKKDPNIYGTGFQKVGLNAQQFAQDTAQSKDGYAERKVGIDFMNVLDKFISQPTMIEQKLAQ